MTLTLLTLAALAAPPPTLPPELAGKAQVLKPKDADYPRANVDGAVMAPGSGGVSEAVVVRLTQDVTIWRLWSGPDKVDGHGRTNRLGAWWSAEAPRGTVEAYRRDYEVCAAWNDLTWVASCVLRKGAVVAAGPGQSVSEATCGAPGESYPADARHWQIYVNQPWNRMGTEIVCQPETDDYPAYAEDLSLPAVPPELVGKVEVVGADDPAYGAANVGAAVKPAGSGGVSRALVVRLTEDVPVWRMWNGPDKLDASGRTNRLGGWWTATAPSGTVDQYRADYEICRGWNDLTYVAGCVLRAGAVVATGPGQSVSEATCGAAGESYPASPRHYQVYVDQPWARPPTQLVCSDYAANPADLTTTPPK
ncbi:MAG TPA: hypothetical protein PKA64_11665 [Myxococcota bacterium]|nr:hypothetical protein [Myxococcota bacterium]